MGHANARLTVQTSDLDRVARMPLTLSSGRTEGYGFGWQLGVYRGTEWVGHSGGIDGFRTLYVRFPEHGLSIIALGNYEEYPVLHAVADLAEKFLAVPTPAVPPAGPIPTELLGTYHDYVADAELIAEDGELTMKFARRVHRLRPLDEAGYVSADDPDVLVRIHPADDALTVAYPFGWITAYRQA